MLDALFSQPNYVASRKMLDATVLRHEAIASNLSNLETPHYKRIDVAPQFANELKQALAAGNGERISGLQPTLAVDQTAFANNTDGNSVQLETELMKLNENTMAHTLETQLISGTFHKLRLAITGRPS
jgi:flagellar basal-body rod protein FlgB